jgi:hypothetical protein
MTMPESHLTRENLATLDALGRCIARLAAVGDAPQSTPSPPR